MMRSFFLLLTLSLLGFLASRCEGEPYRQGRILYENFCTNCHMDDGTGLQGLIPPLSGSDYLEKNNLFTACIIRYGQVDTIIVNDRTYQNPMPGFSQLSDFEITNVINYINQAWTNDFGYVKLADVRQELESCGPIPGNEVYE